MKKLCASTENPCENASVHPKAFLKSGFIPIQPLLGKALGATEAFSQGFFRSGFVPTQPLLRKALGWTETFSQGFSGAFSCFVVIYIFGKPLSYINFHVIMMMFFHDECAVIRSLSSAFTKCNFSIYEEEMNKLRNFEGGLLAFFHLQSPAL